MGLLSVLSLWSPGVLLLALVIALLARLEGGRKPSVILSCVFAVLAGCFGAFGIERIQPGGWNFQFLFLPFLWCKWAVIGFCGSWFLMGFGCGDLRSLVAVQWFFGITAMVLLGLAIATHTYVPAVYQADREFWRKVFFKRIANLPLDEYRKHLSFEGREAVSHQLQYDKQTAPELLPILVKILPRGIADIADQTTLTRPLIEHAQQDAAAARNRYVPGSAAAEASLPQLARNPSTPIDVLEKLALDPSASVRANLALNKGAPPSVLEKLVNDEAQSYTSLSVGALARVTLAEHPQTSGARLIELGHDPVPKVRAAAARNLNAPLDLLAELTRDMDSEVARFAWRTMGRSPNTPITKLEELAEHPDRNMWAAVASNPKAPLALVAKLLHRDDYETRMAAIRNLASGDESARETLRQAIRNFDNFDPRGLSTEHRLPKWVYIELTHADHYEARQNAFERLSNVDDIAESELRDLLSRADKHTLDHLAGSSRCSPLLLRILAESPLAEIQMKARKTLDYVTEHGVYDK